METMVALVAAIAGVAFYVCLGSVSVVPLIYGKRERWIGPAVAVMALLGAGVAFFVIDLLAEAGLPKVWVNGLSAAVFGVGATMTGLLAHGFYESALDEQSGTKCVRCGQRGFVKVTSESSSYDTTMTETVRTTHYSSEGDVTGYSDTEVEVPAVSTYTTYTYRCDGCRHSWVR